MPSMPRLLPLFPDPPFEYKGAEFALAMYRLPAERCSLLLPPGLRPGALEACLALFAHYPVSSVGPYDEVSFMVSAECGDESGIFCPFICVTTGEAQAAGREIWGFPKKMGDISLARSGEEVCATLVRNGASVEFRATLDAPADPAFVESLGSTPILNEKFFPSVDGAGTDIHVITSTALQVASSEALMGTGTVRFDNAAGECWDLLVPDEGDEIAAFWMVADVILPAGRMVALVE